MNRPSFSALLSVIVLGAIVTVMVVSLLNLGSDRQQLSQVLASSINARNLATSCSQKALLYLGLGPKFNQSQSYQTRLTINASRDAMIRADYPDYNYGKSANLALSQSSALLLYFDLAQALPADAEVLSATVKLSAISDQSQSAVLSLHRILPANYDWPEGAKQGELAKAGVTWNYYDYRRSSPWAGGAGLISGVDYDAVAESVIEAPVASSTIYQWTLKPSTVNDWLGAVDNSGLVLKTDSVYWHWFASQDNASVHQRPSLELIYRTSAKPASAGGVETDSGYCFYQINADGARSWSIDSTAISDEVWSRQLVIATKSSSSTSSLDIISWEEER